MTHTKASSKKTQPHPTNYFGDWIEQERQKRDLSYAGLATLFGLKSTGTIYAWCWRWIFPRPEILPQIAKGLGVPLDFVTDRYIKGKIEYRHWASERKGSGCFRLTSAVA